MNNQKIVVLTIIFGFVSLSIYSWFPTPETKDLIRLTINCILCWFLYRGANWSRWVMAVPSLLASVTTATMLLKIPAQTAEQITTMIGLTVMFIFYSTAAFVLINQKFIKTHFISTET
ncbi:hypothetical protein [Pseudomonas sp.]|uniref:hypothetical protein n=1 Tax=Pseudomonas sp. TaxID=306 RepID=UPI003A984677